MEISFILGILGGYKIEKNITAPGLFSDEEIILDEILSVDPDNMTPINALQLVTRWKKTLSGK